MGGHLNLDRETLNLDGGTLTLDGGTRPSLSPYNLSTVYRYLHQRFPAKSDARITAGIFIGTEIGKLMHEEGIGKRVSLLEKEAWHQFCLVVKMFLGNKSSS